MQPFDWLADAAMNKPQANPAHAVLARVARLAVFVSIPIVAAALIGLIARFLWYIVIWGFTAW